MRRRSSRSSSAPGLGATAPASKTGTAAPTQERPCVHASCTAAGSQTTVRTIESPEALAGARGVIPQRVISEWTPENPEVPHFEMLDLMDRVEYDEDFYDAHEPAGGLKLLGNAVLGKVQSFPDTNGHPPHAEGEGYLCYRSLVQLGTDDGDVSDYTETFLYSSARHISTTSSLVGALAGERGNRRLALLQSWALGCSAYTEVVY
ncbi:hypothetical protein VTO73DRAFT_6243 [Trametes versicolor]